MINTLSNFLEEINEIFNTENIISILAIIMSIFSLIITVRYNRKTFRLTENHNILSKKPMISSNYVYNYSTGEFSIGLENNGLGPAIIQEIKYISNNIESSNFKELIDNLQIPNIEHFSFATERYEHAVFGKNYCIPEKKYIQIYTDNIIEINPNNLKILINHIGTFKIKITYTDLFENESTQEEKLMII